MTICGAECSKCGMSESCKGCVETNGCPFGKQCFIAQYINIDGKEKFVNFKGKLIEELNQLNIPGMPEIEELYALVGSFVNLEYTIPSGETVKLLDDNCIYLGNQLECKFANERCYGVIAGMDFLLVCEYGENGANPELVMYKRR